MVDHLKLKKHILIHYILDKNQKTYFWSIWGAFPTKWNFSEKSFVPF